MADELKKGLTEANVETVEGSGGVFEVTLNGSLIFSKKDTDRFPNEGEVITSAGLFAREESSLFL